MRNNNWSVAFFVIMFSAIVSAGPVEGLRQLTNGLGGMIVVLVQFIGNTIFNLNSFSEFLFAKILLFLIVFLITYTVIKKNSILGNNKTIQMVVSASIGILAIRYLPNNLVQAILIQYGALAVGLTVFFPWAIYFFFLHQSGIGRFGRRLAWIAFATAFFAMWSFKSSEIGSANYIYLIGTAFILFSVIFDKSIHKYFDFASFRKAHKGIIQRSRWALLEAARKNEEHLVNGIVTPEEHEKERKKIEEALKNL